MQTRKCHADADADADANANADANADANRIRTKNNMSPSLSVGDTILFNTSLYAVSSAGDWINIPAV